MKLSIKYVLENNGIAFSKTHSIETLISYAKNNNIADYLVEAWKVKEAIKGVSEYINNVITHETFIDDAEDNSDESDLSKE